MLAINADLTKLKLPALCSPKLDGIRVLIQDGVAYSRNLKPIPSKCVQRKIAETCGALDGHDGEIIVGDVGAKDVFRTTTSFVMAEDKEFDFSFWAFDRFDLPQLPYDQRLAMVNEANRITTNLINSMEELMEMEARCVALGFEGVMIRTLDGPYKQGRSSVKEGFLLKVKRFEDEEAVVVGFEEKMHNANEATKDALGHTKRSSCKENLEGVDTLGSLVLQLSSGATFKVGTGFDDAERARLWANRESVLGKLCKYKFQPCGVKDLPRFPTYLGLRDENDL